MDTNHYCTMDELGRILLPAKLCEQLDWKGEREVNVQINQPDKSLNIYAFENGLMTIDELGRITLGEGILGELRWKPGKISISIDTTDLSLVLKQTTT